MILNCGRWWRKIRIFLLYRHAIAAVISPIFWWRICRRLLRLSVDTQMLAGMVISGFVHQGELTREMGCVFARRSFPEVNSEDPTYRQWRVSSDYADAATSWLEHINTTNGCPRYRQASSFLLVIAVIVKQLGEGKLTAKANTARSRRKMHNRSIGLAFNMPREPDGTRWRAHLHRLRSAVAGNGNTDISIRIAGTGCHFCHFSPQNIVQEIEAAHENAQRHRQLSLSR